MLCCCLHPMMRQELGCTQLPVRHHAAMVRPAARRCPTGSSSCCGACGTGAAQQSDPTTLLLMRLLHSLPPGATTCRPACLSASAVPHAPIPAAHPAAKDSLYSTQTSPLSPLGTKTISSRTRLCKDEHTALPVDEPNFLNTVQLLSGVSHADSFPSMFQTNYQESSSKDSSSSPLQHQPPQLCCCTCIERYPDRHAASCNT